MFARRVCAFFCRWPLLLAFRLFDAAFHRCRRVLSVIISSARCRYATLVLCASRCFFRFIRYMAADRFRADTSRFSAEALSHVLMIFAEAACRQSPRPLPAVDAACCQRFFFTADVTFFDVTTPPPFLSLIRAKDCFDFRRHHDAASMLPSLPLMLSLSLFFTLLMLRAFAEARQMHSAARRCLSPVASLRLSP